MPNRIKPFTIQVLALGLLLSISKASAETIVLKSGKKVVGKIIEQTDSYVVAEVVGIPTTYYRDEIEGIEEGDAGGVATGQRDSIDKQAAAGDIKSNPEYEAIFATIKNFFENRNNPEEALKSVSQNYQFKKRDGTTIDYDELGGKLKNQNMPAATISDFQIIDLKVDQNSAETRVKFVAESKSGWDGQVNDAIINRKVFLQKESNVWKILKIQNPPLRQRIKDRRESAKSQ